MTTKVEKTSTLSFSGKFKAGKLKLSDDGKKKVLPKTSSRDAQWNIQCSEFAMKTHNPIRAIVDGLKIEPNKDKPMIALSIGEFTTSKRRQDKVKKQRKIVKV